MTELIRRLRWLLPVLLLVVAVPVASAQKPTKESKVTKEKEPKAAAKESKAKPSAPVDLNTASQKDLEALPGVGPATAKKIVAGRPYTSVADLSKAGVPKSTIEKISPMVTVSSPSPAPSPRETRAPRAPRAPSAPEPAPPSAGTTPSSMPSPSTSRPTPSKPAPATPSAQGEQPPQAGMVWVNLDTKVYHKEGDRWYGKTKHGKWMTEQEAIAAGYRAAKK